MATAYLTPGVYVEEVSGGAKPIEGVGTAVAAFLGIAEKGPVGKATLVTNWTQFTDAFGGFIPGAYLAHAVYAYFNNGGGVCYIVRIGSEDAGEVKPALPEASLSAATSPDQPTIKAIAKSEEVTDITLEVTPADEGFDLTVRGGGQEEKHEGLTFARGAKNVFDVVNKASKLVTLEEVKTNIAVAERAPAAGQYPLAAPTTMSLSAADTAPAVYEGNTSDRTGMGGLEAIDEITMVCAPDIMAGYQAGALDMDGL
ncbi:MAG: phage tail sheath family protein, partial [Dehalococcoidia bacterium]|nr:phage tail sheath family protein [Dehalococcoidia bacterium]